MTDRRARVLVAVKGLGRGGAERLISEGARFWDRERFEYHVAYALPWKDQLVSDLERLGVPVHCTGTLGASSVPSVGGLRRVMREVRPDLIHAHLPTMGIAARLLTSRPVVYTEHNLAHSYHPATRLANRLTYWRNAAVVAVSGAVAATVSAYPGPSPRVIVNAVDCHFDLDKASAARDALALGPDVPLVVHVGNIRPGKGHETLIRAAGILKAEVPEVVIVSIGGEKWTGDLKRMTRLANEHGVEKTVRFLGRRDDALNFVAAADVFVNPAEVEGLPVALLEAMALGRSVVATTVGGVPGLITHGESGLLVAPLAPADLAGAVQRLLADRHLASALGERARAEVESKYGLETMVRRIETVYREVLAGDMSD